MKKNMTYYSQKDQKWANEQLGRCKGTLFKDSACKITCLASFCGKTPSEVNKIIPYVSGCLTNDETAAKALGLTFLGKSSVKPDFDCIAETDHYKSRGVPQHFFILLTDGRCVDPLDMNPIPKKNPYKIVSYRLFKPLSVEESMEKEFVKAVSDLTGEDYGSNLNENEQKDAAKKLENVKNVLKDGLAEIARVKTENDALLKELEKSEYDVSLLKENLRIQTEKAKEGMEVYGSLELLVQAVKKMFNK